MCAHATLEGSAKTPALRLSFSPRTPAPRHLLPKYDKPRPAPGYRGPRAKIPDQINTLGDWVKWLPGRKWEPKSKTWLVTSPGPKIFPTLQALGFTTEGLDEVELGSFYAPVVELDTNPRLTRIYPRFANPRHLETDLPNFWDFDARGGYYMVFTADLSRPGHRLALPEEVAQAATAQAATQPPLWDARDMDYFAALAAARSAMPQQSSYFPLPALERPLFGFQDSGAKALVGGHSLLTDEPGLGKTTQAISAQRAVGTRRLLCIVPPVSLSNWKTELEISGWDLPIALFISGRKEPEIPDEGAVIVSDALLRARPALLQRLKDWAPQGLIDDEAHRHRTFLSQSTRIAMDLAQATSGLRIPITGTPVVKNPKDLIPLLAISGHLESVFGGASLFLSNYLKFNRYRGWEVNLDALPHLKGVLDRAVWVRRYKDEVLDLPQLMRYPLVVDVDLKPYRTAHKEVIAKINAYLDGLVESSSFPPSRDDLLEWCAGQSTLVSHLRKGAGLCKVPAAVDWLTERVESARPEVGGTWDDPVIIWTHHKVVTEAMLEACAAIDAPVAAIWGESNSKDTPTTVANFQAGKTAVLVASITAAGVAITLTRSRSALFVETDWLPALMQQSVDRMNRIGQTRPMEAVTMVAPGTLDARIQAVQSETAQTLNAVLGGNNDVSVDEAAIAHSSTRQILFEMALKEVQRRL